MCGLFGAVRHQGTLDDGQIAAFHLATASLEHRGPDNQGYWAQGPVYLGHRRLSIIDLSEGANQPFHRGPHVLAYNGEVYNYVELADELRAAGEVFTTHSDTEVVLAALDRWGLAALDRFDGMFAAAWYDSRTGRTVLMRDAFGQKPLYYAADGDGVVFASELGALLALKGRRWSLDRAAIRRFLARGYHAWDETPVAGIRKLPPGHYLVIEGGSTRLERWWTSAPGDDVLDISDDEAIDEFGRLLVSSCTRAMRADVSYGVFLSGGIDSSLVLAACRTANADIRSFCIGMAEPDFDESAKAKAVADSLKIRDSHTFMMDRDTIGECLNEVMASLDEPHGDPGFVNAYFLSRSCRPHLTVGLAGDGGDELFAGYAPFAALDVVPWVDWLPSGVWRGIKAAARLLPASDRYLGTRFKLLSVLRGFPAESEEARFAAWLAADEPEALNRLMPGAAQGFPELDILGGTGTRQQRLLAYYQRIFLPEFVCMHTDRAAMRFGLEVRSPLLSPPLARFANRLPDRLRRRGGEGKWLMRRAAERFGLPPEIVRQKKQGFTFPVARWLKSVLLDRLRELDGPWADDLLDRGDIRRLVEEHLAGRENHYRVLYHLIALKAWRDRNPTLSLENGL